MAKTAKAPKAPKMDSWLYAPIASPTHRYRLICDGNGCTVVYQTVERREGTEKYRGVGNMYIPDYFSQLPDSLQAEPTVREHFGEDSDPEPVTHDNSGRLICPKCSGRMGSNQKHGEDREYRCEADDCDGARDYEFNEI